MRIKINKRYDKKHAVLGAKEYNISTEVFTKDELDKKKETEDVVIKDGYIYVPASRLAEYKVATNWVTYASQIIGHQNFNVGDTLPDYTTSDFTTQTWYSDEKLTTPVTSVATAGKYYCRLEA